ncbi:MAG: BrnT family toxin [Propionibacteriaceae bacterium]|nr:BrnT family toxin [Propionibacteriaceae bacterium]
MEFEYDSNKSQTNLTKHGINFMTAQRLWDDAHRVEIKGYSTTEERWIVTGMIDGKLFSAVITWRDSSIRIISVRRAHGIEVTLYEGGQR